MSAAPLLPPDPALRRKRFTREEVEQLTATGFFAGQRYELIDGELYDKMGQNPPHAAVIRRLSRLLPKLLPDLVIQPQLPVEVSRSDREKSLPEPDIAVLRSDIREYDRRHPRADEAVLLIEVADTSAPFDLSRKAALYARAGLPEYWVVDLTRRLVVVHRRPDGSTYRLVELLGPGDALTLEGRGESIPVADILPESE